MIRLPVVGDRPVALQRQGSTPVAGPLERPGALGAGERPAELTCPGAAACRMGDATGMVAILTGVMACGLHTRVAAPALFRRKRDGSRLRQTDRRRTVRERHV